ncbi:MAG: type II toxin-antitoxin system RelE/ParE family toxin [Allosphingosinicella sp.]
MLSVLQTEEFEDWLDGLVDKTAQKAVRNRILQIAGGLLGDVRSLGGKVSEARIHYGPGYRLYFTLQGLVAIILLCGGEKRSQKRDIAKAKKLVSQLGDE